MGRTPTLRIGERLGDRFEITDVLPAGGMGEVYRARDTELQRDVAIKLLLGTTQRDLQRFIREAQAGAAFKHANVVSIYDFGTFVYEGDDRPYLVMEFIEGTTLRDRMGKARKDQIIRWLSEVADGLQELHRKGFIHRDVKPSNIMIGTTDDRARIVDFGLAKTEGATITTTNTIVGTIDYLSPEQTEAKTLDFRTDIFSFGVVLYEALTGRHPFHRPKDYHTIHAINFEFPEPIREPEGVIVARCLQKDPIDRYDSAADIARALRELQPSPSRNSTPTQASTVDQDASTVKIDSALPHRRRRHLIAALLLILLVSVIALCRKILPVGVPALRQAIVTPQNAMPAASITVSPGSIGGGQSAHLAWASTNASRIQITPGIGFVAPSGKIDVTPQATTTYIISVWNAAGELARTSAKLEVSPAATGVSGSFFASPDTIHPGESTELKWNSFNATRVVITPGVGSVPLQGRIEVSPRATTTYTITVENASSSTHGTATVYVIGSSTPKR